MGQHGADLHHAPRPGRQLGHELVAECPEPEKVDQLLGSPGDASLGQLDLGEGEHRRQHVRDVHLAFEGDGQRLAHGQCRPQPGVLE